MTLGQTGKNYVYTSSSDYNKPLESQFISQLGYITNWTVRQSLNQLADITAEGIGITGAKRTQFKAGNYIYVLSGTNLIGKFVIESPTYDSEGKTQIKGIQSSGSEIVRKQLAKTNTEKTTYDHKSAEDVLLSTTQPRGVLVDSQGSYILRWAYLDATDIISMTADMNNRIKALNDVCDISNKEWAIRHINTGGRFFVDRLYLGDRVGSSTSKYTFVLNGAGRNAIISSGAEQLLKATNDVIVKGRDINGNQIETELFEASLVNTTLSSALDGWLEVDISPSDLTIPLRSGHGFTGLTNFYVKIDNEVIKCSAISGDDLVVPSDGRGRKSNNMDTNTVPMSHRSGSDVVILNDGRQSIDYVRVPVSSTSGFSTNDIYLGSEKMRIVSVGSGYFTVTRAYTSDETAWLNTYAHSSGTYVHDYHTPDNPNSDNNSVNLQGVYTVTYTDNRALNKDMIDKTAKKILDTKKVPSGKDGNENIVIDVAQPDVVWAALTDNGTREAIGCKVTLSGSDVINIDDDVYRVVEYQFSWPQPKLTLYLNNDDVRGYKTGVTSFVEEFNQSQETERQDPTRSQDNQRQEGVGSDNQTSQLSFGQKILDGVVVPDDAWGDYEPRDYMQNDYDSNAASVGYVRALTSGLSATAYWIDSEEQGMLYPWKDRDIVPYTNEIGNLGQAWRRWNSLYATFGEFEGNVAGSTAILEVNNLNTNNDSIRIGKNSSGNWNFRVSGTYISIYNGALDMHNNYITNLGSGSTKGLHFATSLTNNAWRIYGGNDNLVVDKVSGSAGEFQVNETFLINQTTPTLKFNDVTTRIYRSGNNMYFEDNTANGGSPVTLKQLLDQGAIQDHTHAEAGDGGDTLYPMTIAMGAVQTNHPFTCYNMTIDINGNIDMYHQNISRVGTLTFDSNTGNSIMDSSSDLQLQGNTGIYMQLANNGGAIIIGKTEGNIKYLRPFNNSTLTIDESKRTYLGHPSYFWHTAYVRTINLNGVERSTWPSAGSTPGLATVLGVSNSAGAYNIDMNSKNISSLYQATFVNANNKIYDNGGSTDLSIQGDEGISLELNDGGGGVILGTSVGNVGSIRPYASGGSTATDLGASYAPFTNAYITTPYINGHRLFIQSSAPSSPSINDVWIDLP